MLQQLIKRVGFATLMITVGIGVGSGRWGVEWFVKEKNCQTECNQAIMEARAEDKAEARAKENAKLTGQSVWQAINSYREQNGLNQLAISEQYCNNISQRAMDIVAGDKEGEAHAGIEEHVHKYLPKMVVAEVAAIGTKTVDETMNNWTRSPSHNLLLLKKEYEIGCAYASNGAVVVLMGHQKKDS